MAEVHVYRTKRGLLRARVRGVSICVVALCSIAAFAVPTRFEVINAQDAGKPADANAYVVALVLVCLAVAIYAHLVRFRRTILLCLLPLFLVVLLTPSSSTRWIVIAFRSSAAVLIVSTAIAGFRLLRLTWQAFAEGKDAEGMLLIFVGVIIGAVAFAGLVVLPHNDCTKRTHCPSPVPGVAHFLDMSPDQTVIVSRSLFIGMLGGAVLLIGQGIATRKAVGGRYERQHHG